MESNSIYFTDDYWTKSSGDHYCYPEQKRTWGYNLGVFHMEGGEFGGIKSYYDCDLLTEPPPIWIDPKL